MKSEGSMNAITVSDSPDVTSGLQSVPRKRYRSESFIPVKWKVCVAYHLAGKRQCEIARLTGYSPAFVSVIINNPRCLAYRQQLLSGLQLDFEARFAKIIEVIDECLEHADPMVKLSAADKWFKANGKYQPRKELEDGQAATAEDVVRLILEGGGNNVQVNINGSK